jgi:uncharacterized NAD-dependent epimerase/dehydratase family protein
MIKEPYILFLANSKSPQDAKTAFGIHQWRKEKCISTLSYDKCQVKLDLPEFTLKQSLEKGAKTLIIGCANSGGYIEDNWLKTIKEAISLGLDIASGMHQKLNDNEELKQLANQYNVTLHDVRTYNKELKTANGKKRSGKRILTVGTDCSVGKMYTALAIEKEMIKKGYSASFKATGQTGILITGSGIPIDAVISDFISGGIEQLSPDQDHNHYDIIEGQGSLMHPSFAGVSLGLLHGAQPDYLILCHDPSRSKIRHLEINMPKIEDVIQLNLEHAKLTNPNVKFIGIALNLSQIDSRNKKIKIKEDLRTKFNLPICDPLEDISEIANQIPH